MKGSKNVPANLGVEAGRKSQHKCGTDDKSLCRAGGKEGRWEHLEKTWGMRKREEGV